MLKKITFVVALGLASLSDPIVAQTYDELVAKSCDFVETDSIAQAEECLKQAMRLEPANPRNGLLFQNLGTLQRQLGKLGEAEMSYSCAVALLSDGMPGVRANRAQLYAEMSRYADAIEDYTVILQREPQNETWLYERALCRLMAGDTIGAQEDLEFIDTFNPNSAKSRLGMAVIYKAKGELSMAEDLYNALIEANPNSWSLLRDRAEVYYMGNRIGAALEDIDNSIRKNPHDPMSYVLRAQIRYARGDREFARRDLNTAIEKGVPQEVVSRLIEKYR